MKPLLTLLTLIAILLLPGKTFSEGLSQPTQEEKQNPPEGRFIGTFTCSYRDFRLPSPQIGIQFQEGKWLTVVLDSGFSGILINPATAERLNLKTQDGGSVGPIQTRKAYVSHIHYNTKPQIMTVVAHPVHNPKGILVDVGEIDFLREMFYRNDLAGIAGLQIFTTVSRLRFDFDKDTLEWWENPTARYRPRDAIVLPATVEGGQFFVEARLQKEGKPVKLMIDTGTQNLVIPKEFLQGVKPKATSRRRTNYRSAYGVTASQPILLESIELGSHRESDIPTTVLDKAITDCGLLGMNVLRRYRVTFDKVFKEVILEKTESYKETPSILGRSLVQVKVKDNIVLIDSWDDSLPEDVRKQLKKGDQLIAIDRHQVKPHALMAINCALDGFAGTESSLVIQPAGKGEDDWFEITYKRPSLYDAP